MFTCRGVAASACKRWNIVIESVCEQTIARSFIQLKARSALSSTQSEQKTCDGLEVNLRPYRPVEPHDNETRHVSAQTNRFSAATFFVLSNQIHTIFFFLAIVNKHILLSRTRINIMASLWFALDNQRLSLH